MTNAVEAPDKPWLIPEVIDWLGCVVHPQSVVLETGCGGSTVWFAERAAKVITYEHDAVWAAKVQARLSKYHIRARVEWHYDEGYPQLGLNCLIGIDVALIDGRGRVQSVKDALPALKTGGWLILDDSDRERYQPARELMDANCTCKIVFRSGTDETTAWRKK